MECNEWADSRKQFETAEEFFTSPIIGKMFHCSWCGKTTLYSTENMRFYEGKDERNGTWIEGKSYLSVVGNQRRIHD